MAYTAAQISQVRTLANNKTPCKEISAITGIPVPRLHKMGHRKGIKFQRDPATWQRSGHTNSYIQKKIKRAILFLENEGYTVNNNAQHKFCAMRLI